MKNRLTLLSAASAAVFICIIIFALPLMAQEKSSTAPVYRMPPKALADLVDAPSTPSIYLSPDRNWFVEADRQNLPSIAELSQPELRIAGLRINPRTNGSSRSMHFIGIRLKNISEDEMREITGLPEKSLIDNIAWSPDGKRIAFTITGEQGISIWVAELESGKATKVCKANMNDAYFGNPFRWLPDSHSLIGMIVPLDRGEMPERNPVPTGPVIQENVGKAAPVRTYQDLLKDTYDEKLFEHYMTSQLVMINLDDENRLIGQPGIISGVQPSPDGRYLLVETVHKPYSYLVPVYSFPCRVEVWDMEGNVMKQIADLPLAEEVPVDFDAVPTGPRNFEWRQDAPATLCWAEAQDKGDPKVDAEVRDKVFMLPAPFDAEPILLASLGLRSRGVSWANDDLAIVWERWWKTRWLKGWIVKPGAPESEARILFDRSYEDRYNDPGSPVYHATPSGTYVLQTADDGKKIFLFGQGASPEGNRPFFDEFDLATGESKRFWRSEAPYYEIPVGLLDDNGELLLTRRESVKEPPNYFIRNTKNGELKQLTNYPNPTPQLADVQKEMIRYTREDGVELTATLYLPPGYSPEQGPLPMLMWAYPREFKSAAAAAQVSGSPYSFVRISPLSSLVFLADGYAILDGPTMPIIGEGDKEPNDTYVKQLVASAKAAVDEVVRRGVADPKRIAIGGHSYGAFMVANLLAHSDLFATGIARSGAYNRTLTPFGFQSEERTYWEAPEVYNTMSPFMHAPDINEPILLIHGMADNNSGTFPIQSERFYHALKGNGATVRLVMLPFESHGYQARESVMHMLWEMATWLDKYVKNAPTE